MIKRFLTMLVVDAFFGAMFYLWQIEGVEQAGNVFMFMVWFIGIAGLLVLFATPTADAHKPMLAIHTLISRAATAAILIGTIWTGHIVAACFYATSWVIVYGYSVRCKAMAAKGA